MSFWLLYLLLVKATLTSFSGLTSLPVVRADLVEKHHVASDRTLSTAVAVGRTAPGPNGLYVVSLGYQVLGWRGAIAGWLAMITPAFVIIPLLRLVGARADHPRVRSAIRAVTVAAAGLLTSTAVPLGKDTLTTALSWVLAGVSFLVLAFTRLDTVWVILGAAAAGVIGIAITG